MHYQFLFFYFLSVFYLTAWATQPLKDPKDFIHSIVGSHQLPLDSTLHSGCTPDKGRTVGEYFSKLMSLLTDNTNALNVSCTLFDPIKPQASLYKPPKKGKTPWECTLNISTQKNGLSQKLGTFSARLTPGARSLERKHLSCKDLAS